MGIDWIRVRVKPGVDRGELAALVERQAVAFQSIWTWISHASDDRVSYHLRERLHLDAYGAACRALQERLELAEWDEARNCPADGSGLDVCRRVYAITFNKALPPLWQMRANRTFLPEELRAQAAEWRAWGEQVTAGRHDDYLRELHAHYTTDFMREHWASLHGVAADSYERTNNWANNPDLADVRERIVRFPEPGVTEVRIEPPTKRMPKAEAPDIQYDAIFEDVRKLIELTREWDRRVPTNQKVKYDERHYHLTLDAFKARWMDDWFAETLTWFDQCADQGFGLYLDY